MLSGESELNRHQQAQAVKKKALPLNELAVNWEGGERWGGGGEGGGEGLREAAIQEEMAVQVEP